MTALRLVPPPAPPAPLDYPSHHGRTVSWAPWQTALTLPGMSYCCECCLYEGAPWACTGAVKDSVRRLLALQCPDCRYLRVYDTGLGRAAATLIDITNPTLKETGS
jgi:hypothetical protein